MRTKILSLAAVCCLAFGCSRGTDISGYNAGLAPVTVKGGITKSDSGPAPANYEKQVARTKK